MRLNHVTLPCDDLPAAIAFYQALGLHLIVRADPRYARFAVDDASTLSIEVTAGRAGAAEIFLHCDNVDADHDAAAALGIIFDWPPTDQTYLWRTAGTRDPSGNHVVLYHAGANQHFPPWRVDGRRVTICRPGLPVVTLAVYRARRHADRASGAADP